MRRFYINILVSLVGGLRVTYSLIRLGIRGVRGLSSFFGLLGSYRLVIGFVLRGYRFEFRRSFVLFFARGVFWIRCRSRSLVCRVVICFFAVG